MTIKVTTVRKSFHDMNVIDLEVGTNCPKEGDSGSKGRTIIRISNGGGTDLRVKTDDSEPVQVESVAIILGGDAEARTLVRALRFSAKMLKAQLRLNKRGSELTLPD